MSGQGVGSSPNVAFKAVSARLHDQELTGLSSSLSELQQLLDSRNDREFTKAVDLRCRSLEGMGLCKPDKVTLNDVPSFKHGDDLVKWAERHSSSDTRAPCTACSSQARAAQQQ